MPPELFLASSPARKDMMGESNNRDTIEAPVRYCDKRRRCWLRICRGKAAVRLARNRGEAHSGVISNQPAPLLRVTHTKSSYVAEFGS